MPQATACAPTATVGSRRRELEAVSYASHTSHPFCCSSSRTSHPFSCSYPLTCTRSISVLRLLTPKTTQIPLQLRRPPLRVIAETLCPRARPQFSCLALGLAGAICVALIDPIALRLAKPVRELRPARFLRLAYQLLVRPIQVSIVGNDRPIEAVALRGHVWRVARIAGRPRRGAGGTRSVRRSTWLRRR